MMDPSNLPSLVEQTEHDDLHTIPSDTMPESILYNQRDCVENMTRNLINVCMFYEDGTFRPDAEEQLLQEDQAHPKLLAFYRSKLTNHDESGQRNGKCLLEDNFDIAREWLDVTPGFADVGVVYDPLNEREVLTGVDNLLALFAGLFPAFQHRFEALASTPDREGSLPLTPSRLRCLKLREWVKFMSTPTLEVSIIHPEMRSGELASTYNDLKLAFTTITPRENHAKPKRRRHVIELLITTEHHCTKYGNVLIS